MRLGSDRTPLYQRGRSDVIVCVQLRISVTMSLVVLIELGISTFLYEAKELFMKTIIKLICVMAGAARLWRSG